MKRATTIEEQISIIKKRGVNLDYTEEKCKEILSDIGYFRFGYYCFPFEIDYPKKFNRTHQYKEGTNFSEIVALYYFNFNLSNILLRYIARIEINIRTGIIYIVSNYYQASPAWFADTKVMNKGYLNKLPEEYQKLKRRHHVLKNHHKKHQKDFYAPAWKTLEYFSFGAIQTLYKNLNSVDVKKEIAQRYNVRSTKVLENYINIIVKLRNLCAHSNVLFDEHLPFAVINGPALNVDVKNKHKLYSYLKVVEYMLNHISVNRCDDMIKEIQDLIDAYKGFPVINSIIENNIKYNYSK